MDQKKKIEILKDRADVLRQKPQKDVADNSTIIALEFLLSNEKYAIDSSFISEVLHIENLTTLPCTPNFIIGLINIRGRIVSVIEIKRFLDLPVKGISNLNKVIIIKKEDLEFGILTDEVNGNVSVNLDQLQSANNFENGLNEGFIKGISNSNLILLDMEEILKSEKIIVNEKV